jgi:prophage regulatory protein
MVCKILRVDVVLALRGKSRSGHYADVASGLYTRPVKIGPRASGWPEPEVAALQAAVIAGTTQDEVRALVRRLELDRTKLVPHRTTGRD